MAELCGFRDRSMRTQSMTIEQDLYVVEWHPPIDAELIDPSPSFLMVGPGRHGMTFAQNAVHYKSQGRLPSRYNNLILAYIAAARHASAELDALTSLVALLSLMQEELKTFTQHKSIIFSVNVPFRGSSRKHVRHTPGRARLACNSLSSRLLFLSVWTC